MLANPGGLVDTICRRANIRSVPRKDLQPATRFDLAIERFKLPEVWDAAHELPCLTLARALRLTMLLGKERNTRFEPAARRFLERFLREEQPSVEAILKTVDGLNALGDPLTGLDAWAGLLDLSEQIERRRL
jgi:hypothetical protein